MQCDRCNAESIWERHFERGAWGFGKGGMLCPWCRTYLNDAAALSSQRLLIGLIGAGVLLQLTLGVGRGASNIWVWAAALVGLTVAHELAHAAVGWLVGLHIHAIRIGSGRVAFRFTVLGTCVEVCRVFVEGGACCVSHADERKRWQIATCIGAPLVMHAVLIPISILWEWPSLIIMLNALALITNLHPQTTQDGMQTDGLQLLNLWRNNSESSGLRWAHFHWSVHFALAEGRNEEAFTAAERALSHYPENIHFRLAYVDAAVRTGRFETALEVAERAAPEDEQVPVPTPALAAASAITAANYAHMIRGSVMLDMRRFAEAEAEFEQARQMSRLEEERCHFQALIALARLLGNKNTDYRHAYERLPWLPNVLYTYVVGELEARNPDAALDALRVADAHGQFDGGEGNRWALEAAALAAKGETKRAQRRFKQARRNGAELFAVRYVEQSLGTKEAK